MANNKVQLADGTTLIDLTSDTVTPQTMLAGTTAHAASGEQITGVVNLANAGDAVPLADSGSGAVGASTDYAREDHAHPFGPAIEVPTATVDPNSTSTNFIIQVPQFAHKSGPEDGMFFIAYNDVVNSQAGCTLNVNGWGAKPMYNAKKEVIVSGFSRHFFPVWYNSTFVSGGCWIIGYLYDTNYIPSSVQTPHQDEVAGAIGISSGYAREDHIHPINKNAVKQDNYNLFGGTITNTIKTVSLASGRKISDFSILFASVINTGGWQRASAIIFGARFANGENISMIDVNSANTQTWFEISYVDDTHIKIQSSANGSGATITLYGLGSGILYS